MEARSSTGTRRAGGLRVCKRSNSEERGALRAGAAGGKKFKTRTSVESHFSTYPPLVEAIAHLDTRHG